MSKSYSKPHKRVQIDCFEESMTKQCFRNECDINAIMKRYEKTGLIDHVKNNQPQYGDFTDVVDYHTALNRVTSAQSSFMQLPADLRAKFSNDAGNFIEFINNPENQDEMVKMGLASTSVQELSKSDDATSTDLASDICAAEGASHSST